MTTVLAYPTSEEMSVCKDLLNVPSRNLLILAIFARQPTDHISASNLMKNYKELQSIFPLSSLYENLFKLKSLGFLECRRNSDDQRLVEFKITLKGVSELKIFSGKLMI
jgi:DNA-binding PadR family transcriptional regulator